MNYTYLKFLPFGKARMGFRMGFFLLFLLLSPLQALADKIDSIRTVDLQEVNVISSIKDNGNLSQLPASVSMLNGGQLTANHITSLKGVSNVVPNIFIPDYGSRLTSAIYIRGIGSRLNTPAVGLYVDNIPYIDKSAFDFNFYDIERVDVLRGPQGTLYGRNTMGGLMRVYTRNPFHYEGTTAHLGYATGDAHRSLSLTHYHRANDNLALSLGGYYESGDGFFKNVDGRRVDAISASGGRLRSIFKPSSHLSFDLTASYDYSDEGAYPYYYVGDISDSQSPSLGGGQEGGSISNNRESSYRRNLLNVGLNTEYRGRGWTLNAITSYQNLCDRMMLDQDFMQPDIYTLEQRQRINTINQEIIIRSNSSAPSLRGRAGGEALGGEALGGEASYSWLSGINMMYQSLHTTGPVTFYPDGMQWLASQINGYMPDVNTIPSLSSMGFSSMRVNLRGDDIVMGGTFDTPTLSLAAFHQSSWRVTPRLTASVGLRLDYEHTRMTYDAPADVDYGFTLANSKSAIMNVNLQDLSLSMRQYAGRISNDYLRLLPKFTVTYNLNSSAPSQTQAPSLRGRAGGEALGREAWGGTPSSLIYTSISRGMRSGGYNVQMFSDLLQGAMQRGMMLGIQEGVEQYMQQFLSMGMPAVVINKVTQTMRDNMPIPASQRPEDVVVYKPEYSWNYELGTHGSLHHLTWSLALFYARIYNQQIARFSPSGLGRMMVNAGKSHSRGLEATLTYKAPSLRGRAGGEAYSSLILTANYGYTHATFIDYDDGHANDYSGRYVPYVPKHTLNLDAAYTIRKFTFGINFMGAGRIYWTEDNAHSQPFYTQLGARIVYAIPRLNVTLWGKNLLNRQYNTFYFHSASRAFEQHGKPIQVGIDVTFEL